MTAGWRVAGACAAALPVVLALVFWRSTHLDGGWLVALQVAAALAVAGLVAGCWLAVLHATRLPAAPERRELVLRVEPGQDGPTTSVVPPPPVDETPLRRAVGVALAAAVPLLLVLLLGAPGQGTSPDTAAAAARSTATASAAEPSESPSVPAGSATSHPTESSPPTPVPSPEPPRTPPGPAPPAEEPAPPVCEVVVVAGDTLWELAEQRLGPGATDAEIDATWRADYAANAGVIGPDPDLILPGQVLVVSCASG
ncbi:MAG: LysM peptidoglycan-binding domain-containing protein [Actinomycetes bacterium]